MKTYKSGIKLLFKVALHGFFSIIARYNMLRNNLQPRKGSVIAQNIIRVIKLNRK